MIIKTGEHYMVTMLEHDFKVRVENDKYQTL